MGTLEHCKSVLVSTDSKLLPLEKDCLPDVLTLDVWDKMYLPRAYCSTQNECFCFGCLQSAGSHIPHGSIPPGVVFFFLKPLWGNAAGAY